ncbi:hypothetical protein NC653_020193 [Populus alba x Populus x berolinensis]|uniref:Uncharacterized protein n=1 Tax=Populus alba x Populus x berolinensis TaxID=444605 RepID=A0AAD6MJX7_9ROSI|nr:hypothetical protein NC653_020193 [Populus alba x Populus x berolinensis]
MNRNRNPISEPAMKELLLSPINTGSMARQDESASPCSTISCSQLRPLFHIKLERGSNGLVRRRPLTDADDCIKDGQFLSSMIFNPPDHWRTHPSFVQFPSLRVQPDDSCRLQSGLTELPNLPNSPQ